MPKRMSLAEAIDRYVHDGDLVYLAGFTHLIPFAAGHEIIRQRKRGLILARATPDLIYDQMVAAGCARRLIFSWAGNPGVGMLHAIRRAVEAGEIEIEEYTHFAMVARLTAGAAGLPFMPMRPSGHDLPRVNPHYREVTCPFTGERLMAVPALQPDVAIVHVQRADEEGNAQIWGIIGEQKEAALAARRVIVTAEEIVPPEVIRQDPNRTVIPGFLVTAVCHGPYGAHPSYAQGYYDRDNAFYVEWDAISRDPERLNAWLEEWVYGVPDRAAYWEKLGPQVHQRVAIRPAWSAPVNYGEVLD